MVNEDFIQLDGSLYLRTDQITTVDFRDGTIPGEKVHARVFVDKEGETYFKVIDEEAIKRLRNFLGARLVPRPRLVRCGSCGSVDMRGYGRTHDDRGKSFQCNQCDRITVFRD
jgi:hypothetical protein